MLRPALLILVLNAFSLSLSAEDNGRAVIIVRVDSSSQNDTALHPVTHPQLRRLTLEGVHLPNMTLEKPVGAASELWRLSDALAHRLRQDVRVATVRSSTSSAPDAQGADVTSGNVTGLRKLAESFDDPGQPTAPELEFFSAVSEILSLGAPLPSAPSLQPTRRLPIESQVRRELEKGARIVIVEDSGESAATSEYSSSTEALIASVQEIAAAHETSLSVALLTAAGGRQTATLTVHGSELRRGWVIPDPVNMDEINEFFLALLITRYRDRLDSKTLQEAFRHAR